MGIPLLGDVVDSLGFGPAQARFGFLGGGTYLVCGMQMLIFSAVTDAIGEEWALHPTAKGLIVSLMFVGKFAGNMIAGPIGDNYGRKQLIIVNFVGLFVLSLLCSWAHSMAELDAYCFFIGVMVGIGGPAWSALGAEICPTKWRIIMMGVSQTMFIIGEIYACLLLMADDPTLKHIHWRRLFKYASIPSGVHGVLALLFLHQSPSFLAVNGEPERATAVLDSMRYLNGKTDHPIDFHVPTEYSELNENARRRLTRRLSLKDKKDAWRQLRIVFGPQYRRTTFIMMYTCFALNLVTYGSMYAFPQVFARRNTESGAGKGALELLIGCLWEIGGFAAAVTAGFYMKRITSIAGYLLFTTIFLLMFTFGNSSNHGVMMMVGFDGLKLVLSGGVVLVYQYSIEVYPTIARTTGHGLCLGFGRIACVIAPMLYESLYSRTGYSYCFFYVLVIGSSANLLLLPFLTIETKDMKLDSGEEAPVEEDHSPADREVESLREQEAAQSKKVAMVPEPLIHR